MNFGADNWDKGDQNERLTTALFGTMKKKEAKNVKKASKRKTSEQIDTETKQAKEFLKSFKHIPKKHRVVHFDVSEDEDDNDDITKRAKRNMKERNRKKRQKQSKVKDTKHKAKKFDSDEELFAEIDDDDANTVDARVINARDSIPGKKKVTNALVSKEAQIQKKAKITTSMKTKVKKNIKETIKMPVIAQKRKLDENPFVCVSEPKIKNKKIKNKKLKLSDKTLNNGNEEKAKKKKLSKTLNKGFKESTTLHSPEARSNENKTKSVVLQYSIDKDNKNTNKKKRKEKSQHVGEVDKVTFPGESVVNNNNKTSKETTVVKSSDKVSAKKKKRMPLNENKTSEQQIDSNKSEAKTKRQKTHVTKSADDKQSKSRENPIKKQLLNTAKPPKPKFNTTRLSDILSDKHKNVMILTTSAVNMQKHKNIERKTVKSLKERMTAQLNAARFRYLNEQLYTQSGPEALKMFQSDQQAFQVYHDGFQSQVAKWPVNPLNLIIKQIKSLPSSHIVADFGCGSAVLAQSVENKVHSFDLVPLNEYVTVCDISKVPLSTKSVDVVVFCLSLMGTNLKDYVSEANRVLKPGGELKVAEVESRISDTNAFICQIESFGFRISEKDTSHKMFHLFYFNKIKPCMKSAVQDIHLEACIYKKR